MRNTSKIIGIILYLFSSIVVFAQTPGISYQAVISDPWVYQVPGKDIIINHLASTEIGMRFSIIDAGGTTEYMEVHTTQTNEFGEVNLIIGSGEVSSGNFSDILWDGNSKQLYVEIDYKRGLGYQHSNTQDLLYMPHPLNGSDGLAITSNTEMINAIKQATGLDAEGNYVANPFANYISAATSLSGADNRLDAAVKTNAEDLANIRNNQYITDLGLSGMMLTIEIEGGASHTIDLSSLQGGIGTDDQTGMEVPLEQVVDIDSDGNNETTVEAAIIQLDRDLDVVSSATTDNQELSLNDETNILTLEEGGSVDLSTYLNTDDQTGSEVNLVDALDADGDGTYEENVEEVITALIDMLFGCTDPTACNYEASPIFENNDLCTDPDQGKNCDGETIAVGVSYQGGLVFHLDGNKAYVVAKEDLGSHAWGGNVAGGASGTDIGAGQQNTQDIMETFTTGTDIIAASLCDSYENEGFDDWFLPSSGALKRIYEERSTLNAADCFVACDTDAYWSSTQSSSTEAKVVDMGSGNESNSQKSAFKKIRAVRFVTF